MTNVAQHIRQTLDLDQVLQRTVEQVRELLKADRVIIFRFQPDWTGTVIKESVTNGYPAILSTEIYDPCFAEKYIEPYRQGTVTMRTDFSAPEIEPCYFEMMKPFQVRANLAVPILQGDQLWGLLIVHQCSAPRQWQNTEIELLKQLATQVSIAIQQSELYQQTRQELLERKKAQEALFKSEQRLQAFLEYAPAAIYLLDLENKYILANRLCSEIMATTQDNLYGKSIYDFWTKEVADTFAANNLQMLQNKQILEIEEIIPQADGLHTYISLKFPLYGAAGEIYAVCGIATDITGRKEAERKITEQAALIDITSDAMIVRDLDHHILSWNQGAERLYGWTATEVIGKTNYELLYKHPGSSLDMVIKTTLEQGFWQGELEQITKTGKEIIVASRWTLVYDDSHQPKSILVVNSDITEKKQLEKQFYQAQRLDSLGTLAGGIAHDLNNVFTPILIISQLLPLKFQDTDDTTQELLQVLEDSVKRGINLVKQVLTFARGQQGQRTPLKVQDILEEVVTITKSIFPKSINISTDIPDSTLYIINADATQLHQVMLNLCLNARDAMPDGGKLTIAAENRVIDQTYAKMCADAHPGNYVMITVSDTGMGIPEEILDRIFEPFFTTKEVGKGTGLGLSTVLGIIKNHGGFLQVFSEQRKGTQFQIYLPAIAENPQPLIQEKKSPTGNGELVLVVDDEDIVRQITKVSLENANYQVMLAQDGIEAIALYARHQNEISFVLMDMMMPNMDGLTAIRTLLLMNPEVNIIAHSGLPADGQRLLEAGAKVFLAKPYTTQQLLAALSLALLSRGK